MLPLFFLGLYHLFYVRFGSSSLSVNYVSLVNCVVAMALSSFYLSGSLPFLYMKTWLMSYFVYDVFILYNKPRARMLEYIFGLHHILSCLTLYQSQHAKLVAQIFLLSEVSNFPMYIVKHYIERRLERQVALWKKIQFAVYAPLRVLGFLPFFFMADTPTAMYVLGTPIYLMGVLWSKQLWQNLPP